MLSTSSLCLSAGWKLPSLICTVWRGLNTGLKDGILNLTHRGEHLQQSPSTQCLNSSGDEAVAATHMPKIISFISSETFTGSKVIFLTFISVTSWLQNSQAVTSQVLPVNQALCAILCNRPSVFPPLKAEFLQMATSVYPKQNDVAASANRKETRGFFSRKIDQTASLRAFTDFDGDCSGLLFIRKEPQFKCILEPYCASLESLNLCILDNAKHLKINHIRQVQSTN